MQIFMIFAEKYQVGNGRWVIPHVCNAWEVAVCPNKIGVMTFHPWLSYVQVLEIGLRVVLKLKNSVNVYKKKRWHQCQQCMSVWSVSIILILYLNNLHLSRV